MADAVAIWGELLWDRFPDGDRLGGAPANVAWHLAQVGGWPQLITRVGNDPEGRRAVEALSQLCDVEHVQVDPERATGEVTVQIINGEPQYTLHPDRAWERIECTDAVKTALKSAGVFVYGTLAQRKPDGLLAWRDAKNVATCTRVCDLNLRPTDQYTGAITEGIAAADIVKANDRELRALHDWMGWDDPIAKLRLRGVNDRPRVVAVTHGADGSTIHGQDGEIRIPGFPATPGGDNVGCGDAYLAVLVHGLTSGWDLARSGRAASRYAAAVASERGATPVFEEARIAELLEVTLLENK